jgi:hypothetical protein
MKTVRTGKVGDLALRLVEKDRAFIGLIFGADGSKKAQIKGADADDVWRRLHDEAGKANPKYFGFDGARARFLRFFPNGFHSTGYTNAERDYKVAAKQRLDETAPLDQAVSASGLGEAILSVFRATNLLSPFEKVRLQDVLRGPMADEFIHAAARFTLGEGKPALSQMERALKSHEHREMDGRNLPSVSVAAGRAHVSEARGHQGFRCPRRPSLRDGLRSAAGLCRLRKPPRPRLENGRRIGRAQAARPHRRPKLHLGCRRL